LERLNALWFGDRLAYLEQLSILSALAHGHAYTLYSYKPESLQGVPAGVEVRDAAEVMSDPRRVRYFEGKFKALGSDFFRYELMAKSLGYWVDLDLIFVRPLDLPGDYVFGWEGPKSINGAVLKLPAGSPMLEELRNIPERNWCPPYFGPRSKLKYHWQRLRGPVELEDLPWGSAGPGMIAYLAKKYGLLGITQPIDVFYPLPYTGARKLFGPAEAIERLIMPNTLAIHMWHSSLGDLVDRPPPTGSYIEKLCRRYDVLPKS
jgi:hypothetical protein